MTKDWIEWHRHYDTPNSSLVHRLTVVHHDLRRALVESPCSEDGVLRLVSMCAGEGRDVLPVLAEHDSGRQVRSLLIELDPIVSQRARNSVTNLSLSGVEVKVADAGLTDTYLNVPPADILLACGIFGNITEADLRRTIATMPALLTAGGIVIWTRSCRRKSHDPSLDIRSCFIDNDFTEMSLTRTKDKMFRIGMHRLADGHSNARPLQLGTRMFTFA